MGRTFQGRRKKTENCRMIIFAENAQVAEAEHAQIAENAENAQKVAEKCEFAQAPL